MGYAICVAPLLDLPHPPPPQLVCGCVMVDVRGVLEEGVAEHGIFWGCQGCFHPPEVPPW